MEPQYRGVGRSAKEASTPLSGKAPDFYDQNTLQTDSDYVYTFLRIIAGIIVFPYGMQKLFGWFGGPGIGGTLKDLDSRRIPRSIAWLIIGGQSFGSIVL